MVRDGLDGPEASSHPEFLLLKIYTYISVKFSVSSNPVLEVTEVLEPIPAMLGQRSHWDRDTSLSLAGLRSLYTHFPTK